MFGDVTTAEPSYAKVRGVHSGCRHHGKLEIRGTYELPTVIFAVNRRTIRHHHHTADLDATVSFNKYSPTQATTITPSTLMSRESGGADVVAAHEIRAVKE